MITPGHLVNLPSSDTILRCHVNLNTYALKVHKGNTGKFKLNWDGKPDLAYPLERFVYDELITDLVQLEDDALSKEDLRPRYEAMRSYLKTFVPNALVGSYLSSQDAFPRSKQKFYPVNTLDRELFKDYELIGKPDEQTGRVRVDYAKTLTQEKLKRGIVNYAKGRELPLLFLDNWRHSSSGSDIDWETTASYMSHLREALHAEGIRLIVNIAWAVAATTKSVCNFPEHHDVELLTRSTDGASFELALHKNIRNDKVQLTNNLKLYRQMLDAGMCVIFTPYGKDSNERKEEQLLQAGWAMLIRNPGDRLWVSSPYFEPNPEWMFWPLLFGKPLGPPSFDDVNANKLSRQFQNGRIEVDVNTKAVKTESTKKLGKA